MNRMIITVLFLALSISSVACGDDSNESNNANNTNNTNNVNNTNNTNNTNNVGQFDNTGIEYRSSYELRFDSLTFDEGTAGESVNGLLAQNFDQSLDFPVVVLVELKDINPEAGTFNLRGGSGLKTGAEGEYIWDPQGLEDYFPGTLTAGTGEFLGGLDQLDFVATLQTETDDTKVIIPIQSLDFEGNLVLSDDGTSAEIPNGRLAGFLTKEDGDTTQIQLTPTATPVSITDIFKETNLNYDSTAGEIVEKGEGDAWYLSADFSAIPTTIVQE